MSLTNDIFNQGVDSTRSLEPYTVPAPKPAPARRRTNMEYKSSDKKIWDFLVPVSPDPFEPMHAWVVQRLLGDWGTPNVDGHDENGWRDAALPAATRVVYMQMTEDGQMVNVFGGSSRGHK